MKKPPFFRASSLLHPSSPVMLSLAVAWALSGLLGDITQDLGRTKGQKPKQTETGLQEGRDPAGDVTWLRTAHSAPPLSEEVTPDPWEHPPSCALCPQLNADQHGKEKPPCSPCPQRGDTATLSGHQPPQIHCQLLFPSVLFSHPTGCKALLQKRLGF